MSGRGLQRVPYLVGIALAAVVLATFPKWTVDDAYITFRYAHNLATHGELNWNVGEDPVEGYTGVALPVVLAILMKASVSPLIASQTIGVGSFVAGGWILFVLLGRLGVRELARSFVLFLYLAAPLLYTHAFAGLETLLFSTAILGCMLALLSCLEPSRRLRGPRESLLLGLLLLTSLIRPEGVVLAASSLAVLVFERVSVGKRELYPLLVRGALIYLLPGLSYFLWRWNFYGQLLPNPFYVKSYLGLLNPVVATTMIKFTLLYLFAPMLVGLITTMVDLDLIRDHIREKRILPKSRSFLLVYAAALGFVLLTGLQYLRSLLMMNYSYRFFVPFFVIGLVGIGVLLHLGFYVMRTSADRKPLRDRLLRLSVTVLIVGQVSVYLVQLRHEMYFAAEYKQLLEDEHLPAGAFLKERMPSSEWLIVHGDSGAIPYLSGLRTADFGRLNNETLSRLELSRSEIVDYFFSFNAGAVVFTSFEWERLVFVPEVASIIGDPRFGRYVLAQKYGSPAFDEYSQFVFLRKDLSDESG